MPPLTMAPLTMALLTMAPLNAAPLTMGRSSVRGGCSSHLPPRHCCRPTSSGLSRPAYALCSSRTPRRATRSSTAWPSTRYTYYGSTYYGSAYYGHSHKAAPTLVYWSTGCTYHGSPYHGSPYHGPPYRGPPYQATPTVVYWQYFHLCALLGPMGWGLLLVPPRTDAAWFMIVCGGVSLYFSNKMIRLVLLLSPAAAVCAGAALGWVFDQTAEAMLTDAEASAAAAARERAARAPPPSAPPRGSQAPLEHHEMLEEAEEDLLQEVQSAWRENVGMRRAGGCGAVLLLSCMLGLRFVPHAWRVGQQLSEPQLLFRGVNLTGSGELVQVCWPCLLCGRAGCGCAHCAYYGCACCGCAPCGPAHCGCTHHGTGGRPYGGVLVAARPHARGRARHGVVGLRLPNQRRRQPHDPRRR